MAQQTYQLVVTTNAAGQFCQNIFHWRMDDAGFANRLVAAKGLIDGFIADGKVDKYLDMVPDAVLLKSLKARRVTNGGGPEYIDVSLDGSPGTFGAGLQASANGPTIIWNTNGGARRVGKTFLPGLSSSKINGGEIAEAAVIALYGNANLFRDPFAAVGGGGPECVFCIPRSNDPATRSLVLDVQVGRYLGVQRRRQLPV